MSKGAFAAVVGRGGRGNSNWLRKYFNEGNGSEGFAIPCSACDLY